MRVGLHQGHSEKAEWDKDIRVAKQLGYSAKVIALLKAESNQLKRQRILIDARRGKYDDSRK